MVALKKQFNIKYQSMLNRTHFYVEGLEMALVEKEISSGQEINRLNMIIEDNLARQVRLESKMSQEKQTLIDQYISRKPKLETLAAAVGYIDELREVLRMQN